MKKFLPQKNSSVRSFLNKILSQSRKFLAKNFLFPKLSPQKRRSDQITSITANKNTKGDHEENLVQHPYFCRKPSFPSSHTSTIDTACNQSVNSFFNPLSLHFFSTPQKSAAKKNTQRHAGPVHLPSGKVVRGHRRLKEITQTCLTRQKHSRKHRLGRQRCQPKVLKP